MVLHQQKKHEEAEALSKEILSQKERTLGCEHPDTLRTKSNVGWSMIDHQTSIPTTLFEELLLIWNNPNNWLHHYCAFGLAICKDLETETRENSTIALQELRQFLGPDDERVVRSEKRLQALKSKE